MKLSEEFWRGKRVLVTGHTGFKGAWLVEMLNQFGAETHGIALPPVEGRPNLYRLGLKPKGQDLLMDIRDEAAVTSSILSIRPEIVFHLAAQALVLPSYEDPIGTFASNVMGTAHVAMASLHAGVRVFINITSDKAYDNREWAWAYRESDPMGGHDPYSASKGAAEIVAASLRSSFFNEKKVPLACLRAGNVIGGGDWAQYRIVPDLMEAFYSGEPAVLRRPRSIRPWQHVFEPLRAYMMVAEKGWSDPALVSRGLNIGPDPEAARTVHDLANIAAQLWGREAKVRIEESTDAKHEATYLKLDSSLIKQTLGWRPLLKFEDALEYTVEWYRSYYGGTDPVQLCQSQIQKFFLLDERVSAD